MRVSRLRHGGRVPDAVDSRTVRDNTSTAESPAAYWSSRQARGSTLCRWRWNPNSDIGA